MNVGPDGQNHIQVRLHQPFGLIALVDRSPAALELYPNTPFRRDAAGLRLTGSSGQVDERGGSVTLFTRIWLGLAPPTGREPGYCAVVGELFESELSPDDAVRPKLRPIFLLDEAYDILLPRLLLKVAHLKDIYLPYIDREDLAMGNPHRHDPDHRLYVWPQEELYEDVVKWNYGICSYPDEEDLPDHQAKVRWPYFQSRNHVVPALLPPYKEDPDRLLATMGALMEEKTESGREMFGHHAICTAWSQEAWQTPQRATAMVAAAFSRFEWSERIDPSAAHDGYPVPTEEEERIEMLNEREALRTREALCYAILGSNAKALIERDGINGYLSKMAPEMFEAAHRPTIVIPR